MVSNFTWFKRQQSSIVKVNHIVSQYLADHKAAIKTPILKKLLKIPMLLLFLFKTVEKQKENLFFMFARLLLTAIAILTS